MVRRLRVAILVLLLTPFPGRGEDPAPVLEVKGMVAPLTRLTVSPRATGFLQDVRVEPGRLVKKGDVLAQLDDAALRMDLRVAQANVKAAEARFEGVKAGVEVERKKFEAHVQRAKVQLDRAGKLGPAVSEAERTAMEVALTIAELDLRAASDGGKATVVRAELEVAQAMLQRAEHSLNESRLIAPMDGLVTNHRASVGQFLHPGDALFEIADVSKLVAMVQVPERALAKVAVGQPCRVTHLAGEKTLAGKVMSVAPVIDPATTTCAVAVEIEPGDKLPRIGSAVVVAFLPVAK